jgi:hypothetical protein
MKKMGKKRSSLAKFSAKSNEEIETHDQRLDL